MGSEFSKSKRCHEVGNLLAKVRAIVDQPTSNRLEAALGCQDNQGLECKNDDSSTLFNITQLHLHSTPSSMTAITPAET